MRVRRGIYRTTIVTLIVIVILIDGYHTVSQFPGAMRFYERSIGYDQPLIDWLHANAKPGSSIGVLSNDYVGEWLNVYAGYRTWSYPALIYVAPASYFEHSQAISRLQSSYYEANTTGLSLSLGGAQGGLGESIATASSELSITLDSIKTYDPTTLYTDTPVSTMAGSSNPSQANGSLGLNLRSKLAGMTLEVEPSAGANTIQESIKASPGTNDFVSQLSISMNYSGYTFNSAKDALTFSSETSSVTVSSSSFFVTMTGGRSLSFIATPPPGNSGPILVDVSVRYDQSIGGPMTFFSLGEFLSSNQISFVVCGQPYCNALSKDQQLFGDPVMVYQDGRYQVYETS